MSAGCDLFFVFNLQLAWHPYSLACSTTPGKEQELDAKEQDLNVLKDITEELMGKVEMLQQQQQLATQEIEIFNKELEARKSSVKELWKTNCEQLNEFDQAMLAKDEELHSLRSLLLSKSQNTYGQSSEFLTANKPSTTRLLYSISRVSEALPNVGELWILSTMTSQAQDGHVIWGTNVQAPMKKFYHISLVKKDTN